jgi:hypothetical protein
MRCKVMAKNTNDLLNQANKKGTSMLCLNSIIHTQLLKELIAID